MNRFLNFLNASIAVACVYMVSAVIVLVLGIEWLLLIWAIGLVVFALALAHLMAKQEQE